MAARPVAPADALAGGTDAYALDEDDIGWTNMYESAPRWILISHWHRFCALLCKCGLSEKLLAMARASNGDVEQLNQLVDALLPKMDISDAQGAIITAVRDAQEAFRADVEALSMRYGMLDLEKTRRIRKLEQELKCLREQAADPSAFSHAATSPSTAQPERIATSVVSDIIRRGFKKRHGDGWLDGLEHKSNREAIGRGINRDLLYECLRAETAKYERYHRLHMNKKIARYEQTKACEAGIENGTKPGMLALEY